MKTEVVFRKFKDHGDIIALFPNEIADRRGNVMSYQRVGQHSGADYNGCIAASTPATASEYKELANELKQVGLNLKILKRNPNNHAKTQSETKRRA